MQPISRWTQENNIKYAKLLKYNKDHMILMPHTDREWLVSTSLHNIIHDINNKHGAFEIFDPRQQLSTFKQWKNSYHPLENVRKNIQ